MLYGIWDNNEKDWVRELPSTIDDGGIAILCFQTHSQACRRAIKHYGFNSYDDFCKSNFGKVKDLWVE